MEMPIRVGLVGAGRRAREVHAPSLSRCGAITFVGVWSRAPAPTAELAAVHGVTAFERYDDLLDSCDAIDFAVPPAVQAELAVAAASRQRSLLLEVPIAADVAGAESLGAVVASRAVVSQVALTWRFAAAVRHFLSLEVPRSRPQGGTGLFMTNALAARSAASAWRSERVMLRILGPHVIDLLDAALGPVAEVRAHGDLDGWVGLQLEHERGRFSDASLSGTVEVERDRAGVEIFGPGGVAAIDCARAVGPEAYETMFAEFAACVSAGTPHELDVRRGLRLLQLAEAAETDLLRTQQGAVRPRS
jgi:predicted dehydrogenase